MSETFYEPFFILSKHSSRPKCFFVRKLSRLYTDYGDILHFYVRSKGFPVKMSRKQYGIFGYFGQNQENKVKPESAPKAFDEI